MERNHNQNLEEMKTLGKEEMTVLYHPLWLMCKKTH
jgi:hypothetical protein